MANDAKSTPNIALRPDNRREPRVSLSIEIEVNGIDRAGRPFRVITKTSEVSDWGCNFYLPFDLNTDSVVSLIVVGSQPHCLPETQPVIFQIMNCRRHADGWLLGASKAQSERLWNLGAVAFPPAG
jgi:hypothetical protein